MVGGILSLLRAFLCITKGSFKFGPQGFICFGDMIWLGHICAISQVLFLCVNPIIYHGSVDVGECSNHLIKWFCHWLMCSIHQFVVMKLHICWINVPLKTAGGTPHTLLLDVFMLQLHPFHLHLHLFHCLHHCVFLWHLQTWLLAVLQVLCGWFMEFVML